MKEAIGAAVMPGSDGLRTTDPALLDAWFLVNTPGWSQADLDAADEALLVRMKAIYRATASVKRG